MQIPNELERSPAGQRNGTPSKINSTPSRETELQTFLEIQESRFSEMERQE